MNNDLYKPLLAGVLSSITIGALALLTYETEFGIFLIASFGASMVLLYGYPESPFSQPKNNFFGHLLTSLVGIFFFIFYSITDIFFNRPVCWCGCFFNDIFKSYSSTCWRKSDYCDCWRFFY